MNPTVRAAAVLIEDGRILLVRQQVSPERGWSLPGGHVEPGETLEECLLREMQEETGLEVALDRLLYVCDRIEGDSHVVHITFVPRRVGGELGARRPPSAEPIQEARMVPVDSLTDYGFSERFQGIVEAGFPNSGTYQGAVSDIGL